jgi:hypothetical protein
VAKAIVVVDEKLQHFFCLSSVVAVLSLIYLSLVCDRYRAAVE